MDQSSDQDDDGFVAIANELLTKFRLSPIHNLCECTASVLVALYEGILGDRLTGLLPDPITKEDEIHNMQLVIDSLEHDVLRIDLSHITGKAIVEGHLTTIRYILEILAGLMEYVMEQIDSEGSTDVEGDFVEDPNMLTSGTISSISHVLQDDISSRSSHTRSKTRDRHRRAPATATRPDDDDTASNSTNELIRLGESAASAYGYNGSTVEPDEHSSIASSNADRISASWHSDPPQDDVNDKAAMTAADSTQDLIREGESLARKYEDHGGPTRDNVDDAKHARENEPEREVPATTEVIISTQNTSISTDSSASWPKHPKVSSAKPPCEFDTLGLGLRSRSYNAERETSVDSVLRGIGRQNEEITRPHQHVHTHHHYHQPVGVPRSKDHVYASSLSFLPSSDVSRHTVPLPDRIDVPSSDVRRHTVPLPDRIDVPLSDIRHHTVPLSDRINTIGKPTTSDVVHHNVPLTDRNRSLTSSGVTHGNVPFSDRGRSLTAVHDNLPVIDRMRPSISGGIRENVPFTDRNRSLTPDAPQENLPFSDRGGSLTSGAIHDNVSVTNRNRSLTPGTTQRNVPFSDRGSSLTSGAIRDNELFADKSRPRTSGVVQDSVPLLGTDKLSSDLLSRYVPSYRDEKHPSPKHVLSEGDDRQPHDEISAITKRYLRSANSTKEDFDIDTERSHPDYQARATDRLTRSTTANGRPSPSHERIPGFAPLGDQPFSLASERYKTYLTSRLRESGFDPDTDGVATRPPRLSDRLGDRYAKSFPPYETIDNLPSRPDIYSKHPSGRLIRDDTSQELSRTRQSNLTLESEMDGKGGRYSSFERGLDVAKQPGRRIAFETEDRPVPGGYSKPRITKEILPSESDSDLEESTTHSDSQIDYSPMPSASKGIKEHGYNLRSKGKRPRLKTPVAKQRSVLLQPSSRPNRKVRFEDALDAEAKGELGKIRKKLNKEKKTQEKQKQVLQTVYASNLKEVKQSVKQQTAKRKQKADQEDAEYKQMYGRPRTSRYQPAKKYNVSSNHANRQSRPVNRKVSGKRKRSASSSPTVRRHRKPLHIGDDEMLPTVMQEFPFLHVSPETAHNMWSKQMRQMEQLTKAGLDLPNKNKTQIKMEEAERRQEILVGIMKKELAHNQRMRDIKERRAAEHAVASKAREQKQVTARARRYYDEFRLRAKSRMMKKRNREEQIFKKLFEDGLAIQKARIREMRKYAREKREKISARQQDEIDSLENYYRDQFSMLAETIAKERHEIQVRDNAQNKVMEQMKREMRRKMEREIRDFQEQLYQDEDTEYFRQIEADRMRRQLQTANYKTQL